MNSSVIIIVVCFLLFAVYAYNQEVTQYQNGFSEGASKLNDTKSTVYKRVWRCLTLDRKTIKWRRTYLSAIVTTFLIFLLIHHRFPSPSEIVLYVMIIYSVWYVMWDNYLTVITDKAIKMGEISLRKLKHM